MLDFMLKAFEPRHTAQGMQHRGFHGRWTQMLKKRRAKRTTPIAMLKVKAFDPQQKRWPKGNPKGGQWKSTVSGQWFTGRGQRGAREAVRQAERVVGKLPAHSVYVSRKFKPNIEGEYGSGKIRVNSRTARPTLETAHEIGHLLDDRRFGTSFGSVNSPQFAGWRRAVDRTPTVSKWRIWNALGHIALGGNRYFVGRSVFSYALSRKEQFARSFAQYLARKSGGRLRRELRIVQKSPVSYYWQDREFRGIERELDKLFR